ncbi:DUF4165 domain-containing protein [Vibrio cincinnatiensis]|uniref:DUF4165 domain-containing protein n=1 Tax=Vibrio cincinnatiensis TaxID=675 RepID=UPI001EDDBF31
MAVIFATGARKVKISIVRPDGSVVNSATSHLLGGADRITVNGKSYYGAELELAAPGEGEYSFKAEILTSVGDSVQTDTYPIIVDITPPVISGEIQWVRSGFSMGSIDVEQLTRWTIDKEKLKQYGYSCHEGENKQYEDLGYILVAIGHYYRSLMDNCSYQIGEHINFKSYFGYWLRAMHPNAQTNSPVLEALKHFYPANGDQGLSIGATSWAPTWWLQEQGRI